MTTLSIVLDFDETITTTDSLSTLATASARYSEWAALTQAYYDDLASFDAAYTPSKQDRTLQQHLAYLGDLKAVELQSVRRIEQSRFFEGVTKAQLEAAAQKVVVCDGFEAFLTAAKALGSSAAGGAKYGNASAQHSGAEMAAKLAVSSVQLGILSVNWSRNFIHAALPSDARRLFSLAGVPDGVRGSDADGADGWIAANELVFVPADADASEDAGGERASGKVSKNPESLPADAPPSGLGEIVTGVDKLRVLRGHRASLRRSLSIGAGASDRDETPRAIVVYVGDSNTDLPCLLDADVGVVMGRNAGLAETCRRHDIDLRSLPSCTLAELRAGRRTNDSAESSAAREKVLYRIDGFDELSSWLEATFR